MTQAQAMSARLEIRWDLRPVVYAKLLETHGLLGPGEVPAKRRAMFADVVRCARLLGQPFSGPPAQGLPAAWLADRIREPCLKADLRALTQGALTEGVFGVPTFICDGDLFWGHDRPGTS
jgi:2-hydroxychromene-2-carboxylate isomerase